MRKFVVSAATVVVAAGASILGDPGAGAAQEAGVGDIADERALRVYLDCQDFWCDFDYFRREIEFASWVRDRADADVHVLGTARGTGGGGREYTFDFLGRGEHAARSDTLRYVSSETDTREETRAGLARTVEIGLLPYIAGSPVARSLVIDLEGEAGAAPARTTPEDDPWDYWVFEVEGGGRLNGESQRSSTSVNWEVQANRTTRRYKIHVRVGGWYNEDHFEFADEPSVTTIRRSMNFSALTVRSLGPHWSAGMWTSAGASTFRNQDFSARAAPAVEYSVYPYSESSRRQLTIRYSIGPEAFDYEEVTIFDETSELLSTHELDLGLEVRQPWGSVGGSVEASQYLHDFSKHRLDFRGNVDVRIFRGLSLDLRGRFSRIKDQLYLSKAGLEPEEVLTSRRELGTDFEYSADVGVSYSFGSIFNNVVNPRFGG